ncbi:MAG: GntR family transcriptional regulator [Sphingobium sp.]
MTILPTLSTDRKLDEGSTSDMVASIIRSEIASGRMASGTKLPKERDLVDHFGISRPTLREALRILQSEGLLAVTRGNGGGARVIVPEPRRLADYAAMSLRMRKASFRDTLEIRRLLEPAAIARLARRPNREVIGRLAQIAAAQVYCAEDQARWADYELEFRRVLLENCDSEPLRLFGLVLDGLITEQWSRLSREVPTHKYAVPERSYGARTKARTVEMIDAGAAESAAREWAQYLDDYEKGVLRHGGPGLLLDYEADGESAPAADAASRSSESR